jgi:hypothetical protein
MVWQQKPTRRQAQRRRLVRPRRFGFSWMRAWLKASLPVTVWTVVFSYAVISK